MKENAAAKSVEPMEQMEQLKKILMQLNQINEVQVVNMIQDSFKVMDAQHQILFQELQNIKAQLNTMQASGNTSSKRVVNNLKKNVSRLGNYLSQMKKSMGKRAAGIVKNFKAHGIIALDNIAGKLGVKEAFQSAEKYFNKKAGEIQKSIDIIDTVSHEVSEVKTHKQNIGRALKGKELKEVPAEQGKFFAHLKVFFTKCLKCFISCSNKAHDMVVNLERLELKALDAKQSVLGKLDNFKEDQAKQLPQSVQPQDRQEQNASEMEKNNNENQEQSDGELHREQEGKKSEQEQKPQNPGDKQKKHEERDER